MKSNIKSINNYLDNNIRIKVIFTIFLMFLSSFLDALSIGIVIPIITTFVNPDLLSENGLLEKISQFFLIDFKETNKSNCLNFCYYYNFIYNNKTH